MKAFFVAGNVRKIRGELAGILDKSLTSTVSSLELEIDKEINQELKERIVVLILNEAVNDMPIINYIAVWEDGSEEIRHIYMSPKIEDLLGYSPDQLKEIGFRNIAGGKILSFFREQDHVEERLYRHQGLGGLLSGH